MPLLVVEFELDHYDIPKAFQPQLNAFGRYLKDHPQTTAELMGYADNSGLRSGEWNAVSKTGRYGHGLFSIEIRHLDHSNQGARSRYDHGQADNSTGAARQADRRVYGSITSPKS